jgi:hypothetical protein
MSAPRQAFGRYRFLTRCGLFVRAAGWKRLDLVCCCSRSIRENGVNWENEAVLMSVHALVGDGMQAVQVQVDAARPVARH